MAGKRTVDHEGITARVFATLRDYPDGATTTVIAAATGLTYRHAHMGLARLYNTGKTTREVSGREVIYRVTKDA